MPVVRLLVDVDLPVVPTERAYAHLVKATSGVEADFSVAGPAASQALLRLLLAFDERQAGPAGAPRGAP